MIYIGYYYGVALEHHPIAPCEDLISRPHVAHYLGGRQ